LAWVAVDDVDACLLRIDGHGGKGLSPAMGMKGVGRMAVVQDNTGGVFGVITPEKQA
jgi:predicted enzyme related to lactoylglutathione lyase